MLNIETEVYFSDNKVNNRYVVIMYKYFNYVKLGLEIQLIL